LLRLRAALCYAPGVVNKVGGTNVDLALKLNVLAVCAVFVFVGAILFGAF
jgi:hypothetical protein